MVDILYFYNSTVKQMLLKHTLLRHKSVTTVALQRVSSEPEISRRGLPSGAVIIRKWLPNMMKLSVALLAQIILHRDYSGCVKEKW